MSSLACVIFSYLVGSFPTAYLLGRHFKQVDITKAGTGNVGAMNAFEVTGSPLFGISVGVIDVAKGVAATFLFGDGVLFKSNLGQVMIILSALSAVLGHNYSIFIGFRGGRGLATAAGAMMLVQPLAVAAFLIVYLLMRLMRFRLYISSVVAIFSGFVLVFWKFASSPLSEFIAVLLMLALLSKQLVPLRNELHEIRIE